MSAKTRIEWCDSTINPIMGCTGCALRKNHCYAAILCARYAGRKGWPKSFDQPEFFPGRLEKAVKWSDLTGKARPDKPWLDGLPRHIFVNDLSDGFCLDVDAYGWLLPHLDAMEDAPHIWLLLTKWPARMREFFASIGGAPDNFYLGVSIENQAAADERREYLERCPAAVKYVSYEPALAPVDWTGWEFVSQIISGGESGPGARPSHPDWHRATRDFCQKNGIAYFFKAWGAWLGVDYSGRKVGDLLMWDLADGSSRSVVNKKPEVNFGDGHGATRVGKKRAGRLLDGRTWDEMPKEATCS